MRAHAVTLLLVANAAGAACAQPAAPKSTAADTLVMQDRLARLEQALVHPDSGNADEPVARWLLPDRLREISGLALTADGRLLAHGDERAKVFEIDYRRGSVVKEFQLGPSAVHGDFEAIAVVGDSVMLLTSRGLLYAFQEGANGASVPFVYRDTGLGDQCEFEGMVYEASSNTLLLACKKVYAKGLKNDLVIFRVQTPATKGSRITTLAIPDSSVIGTNGWDHIEPSDITINPFNGDYVMVASRQKALVEVTPAGKVVLARPLPPGHDQAEGVAITRDHILIVSDEAKGGPAVVTMYRWP